MPEPGSKLPYTSDREEPLEPVCSEAVNVKNHELQFLSVAGEKESRFIV